MRLRLNTSKTNSTVGVGRHSLYKQDVKWRAKSHYAIDYHVRLLPGSLAACLQNDSSTHTFLLHSDFLMTFLCNMQKLKTLV